jgi:hypothetical protein
VVDDQEDIAPIASRVSTLECWTTRARSNRVDHVLPPVPLAALGFGGGKTPRDGGSGQQLGELPHQVLREIRRDGRWRTGLTPRYHPWR